MNDSQVPPKSGVLRQMAWLADDRHDAVRYRAGDVICREGDAPDYMYVVRSGEVEVMVGDKVIDTIGPAGIVGEMSLIDHAPRSATVRAKTDCSLLQVDERRFLFLVDATPFFALDVMRIMVERLRAMDSTV